MPKTEEISTRYYNDDNFEVYNTVYLLEVNLVKQNYFSNYYAKEIGGDYALGLTGSRKTSLNTFSANFVRAVASSLHRVSRA